MSSGGATKSPGPGAQVPQLLFDYGTGKAALPRLGGDGMDSESLKHYQTLVIPPRAAGRTNLTNSDRSTSINKRTKSKFVPREPVKAAVKPLQSIKPQASNPDHVALLSSPASSHAQSGAFSTPNVGKSRASMSPPSVIIPGDGTRSPASCSSRQSLSPPPYNPLLTTAQLKDFVVLNIGATPDKLGDASCRSTPPVEEREEVEGETSRSVGGEPDKLINEVKDLKDSLEVQVKVNTDLKKLLVASMGDDLHCKVESLVRTKAQLANEIGGYTKKISDDYENIDELGVQADKWRTKFVAGKVLVEQVTNQRDALQSKCAVSEKALQHLLQEHNQLKDSMLHTRRHLKLLRDSFDPISAKKNTDLIPNILELSRTNLMLAEDVKFKLLGPMNMYPSAVDNVVQNGLSPAEQLACQILVDASEVCLGNSKPVQTYGSSSSSLLQPAFHKRFHPQVRYDNITFNCCKKCKGEIHVV